MSGNAYAANDPPPGTGSADCTMFSCRVEANEPGSSGGGQQTNAGGSNSNDGKGDPPPVTCTYKEAVPQPPAGSLDWDGHKPGDGAVYEQTCRYKNSDNFEIVRMVWSADPPKANIDPAVLARRAVDDMVLRGPDIGITPKPGGKGVVGMPVYMWTEKGPETYGPNVASASTGGITVTATAKVSKIVWNMGDGNSITCTTAGTPYRAEFGKNPSPDCGYRYTQPSTSKPHGKYHVTATSTWTIDWTGGGQNGQLTEVRNSAVDITVAEVQVLN
ncbi:ATP/GTP-binding protein [Streptomyces sp. NPDC059008]|uniref:ATP/GTP-binding protein n=1 Tax=Streptomyces sp. NPDC059008 TaxID=3346693 RepID=UPI00369D046E